MNFNDSTEDEWFPSNYCLRQYGFLVILFLIYSGQRLKYGNYQISVIALN